MNMAQNKCKLIVIDGLDGSGKATQTKLLAERLNENGYKARTISFPDYDSDSSALVKMYLGGKLGLRRFTRSTGSRPTSIHGAPI